MSDRQYKHPRRGGVPAAARGARATRSALRAADEIATGIVIANGKRDRERERDRDRDQDRSDRHERARDRDDEYRERDHRRCPLPLPPGQEEIAIGTITIAETTKRKIAAGPKMRVWTSQVGFARSQEKGEGSASETTAERPKW